jgi:hypothetical protein
MQMPSCQVILDIQAEGFILIRSFRSKALLRLWNDADTRGIRQDQVERVRRVLLQLDAAGPRT